MSTNPLDLENLEPEWYFDARGLQRTGQKIAQLVKTCARSRLLSDWTSGFPGVENEFENEYKTKIDSQLFDKQKGLINSAIVSNQSEVETAWSSVSKELFRDLPIEYIESQLIVTFGSMRTAFINSMGYNQNLQFINYQLDAMQQLLLSYCYLSLYEGLFEEALNFNYHLCFILNPTGNGQKENKIRDKVAGINSTGYSRLLQGFDPTVRNGTAHGHITITSGSFIYHDGNLSATRNYNQLYNDYQEMKKIAYLWQLHVLLHTLKTTATGELR